MSIDEIMYNINNKQSYKTYKRNNLIPSEYNIFNSREWRYTPTNGLLLFFPSEMHHKIEKNESNITRHSLAFNIIPIGTYGEGDSHYESKETL